MLRKLLIINLFVFFVLPQSILVGQRNYLFTREWSVSGYIGSSNFHGDVSDNTNSLLNNTPFSKYFYQDRRLGLGLYVDKMFTPVFGVRGNLLYAEMKSTKESDKIYFTGNLFLYSISGLVDFSNIFLGVDKYRAWNFYGFIGVGYSESRSTLYDMNTDAVKGTNGFRMYKGSYRRMTELTFPVGLGATFSIGSKAEIFVELTRNVVLTNKLDAFPVEKTKMESLGLVNIGVTYDFSLPNHWSMAPRNPRYNGKSTDPSIKAFNKKKHVVMKTKASKKALKQRKKYGRKARRKQRW